MAIRTVGPNSAYPSIAVAMLASGPGDTIALESGYSNETATVEHTGMIFSGDATCTGIVLRLSTTSTIANITLSGNAPINVIDSSGDNNIVGNDGDNVLTVTGGVDAVNGGLGIDRLVVDYGLATGAVTGDSTTGVAEAGGGARLVTITNGTFEHFTINTGSGADTLTTGDGDDIIRAGSGANTVVAGQGANRIVGGDDADTITALDGGNVIYAGNGANTVTTGGGKDIIRTGVGADSIVSGGSADVITVLGGADTANSGAGVDRLIVDYANLNTNVTGGVTGGTLLSGYTGHIADSIGSMVDFVATENFTVTTGLGNDSITTGDGTDVLSGGAGSDLLNSSGGNDVLNGGSGANSLAGGFGNDIYIVDNAGDVIAESVGRGTNDQVRTSVSYTLAAGSEVEVLRASVVTGLTLSGNESDNTLIGSAGGDTLNGAAGADLLNGAAGADTMGGGFGNDIYIVDNVSDVATEVVGEGTKDQVRTSVSYTLAAGSEVEVLRASVAAGLSLTGNGLANTLIGSTGGDTLNGAAGVDVMTGGLGADTFMFNSILSTTNVDRLTDFNVADDTMQLDDAMFANLSTLAGNALSASEFFTGAAAHDADDRIIYNSLHGRLMYDADGDGSDAAVSFARITHSVALTSNDFFVA